MNDAGLDRLYQSRIHGATYSEAEIARALGCSRERVRQLIISAMDKLARKPEVKRLYREFTGNEPVKIESYMQRFYRLRWDKKSNHRNGGAE
jgi:biotin operon repressor